MATFKDMDGFEAGLASVRLMEERCPLCRRRKARAGARPATCKAIIERCRGGHGYKCSGYRCAAWKE